MNDLALRFIRTYVPILIGAVITWLTITFGVEVPEDLVAQAVVFATAAVIALYYAAVTLLARKWPIFERLLGSAKTPEYTPPPA